MCCQSSKPADPPQQLQHSKSSKKAGGRPNKRSKQSASSHTVKDKNNRIYKLLVKVQKNPGDAAVKQLVIQARSESPDFAAYQNPTTNSTPLHMAVRLMDSVVENTSSGIGDGNSMQAVVESLLRAYPKAVHVVDADGNIPLHYAIAPTTHFHEALPTG